MERLQKVLAHAGIASRRAAEKMIEEGRVSVNGEIVQRLGTRVDPSRDAIKVDGRRLPRAPSHPLYYMLHKPRGYVTTLSDPEGRPTVADLLKGVDRRVYPVGRLDFLSEGLLIFTDDGELARDLMAPRKGVPKTYAVKVRGRPDEETVKRLRRGITIEGREARPARLRMTRPGSNSWLEITILEGRKHIVRRMFEAIGHPVVKLRRTGFGGLGLGDLAPGAFRPLTPPEVERLRQAAGGGRPAPRRPKPRRP